MSEKRVKKSHGFLFKTMESVNNTSLLKSGSKGQFVQPERFSSIPLIISKVRTEGQNFRALAKSPGLQSTAVRNNDLAINDKDSGQFAK